MQLTFKQYKTIDLIIMGLILAVCEYLTATAAAKWFPDELYSLSPTITVVCIVMMRWNGFAAIHAVLGGLVYCISLGADSAQLITYCVGNCFALIALVLFKLIGKEKLRSRFYFTLLFAFTAFLGAQVGRWAVSIAVGGPADTFVDFVINDIITLLFTIVVVLISRKPDGLFEDQKSYLIRTDEERRKEEAEKYYK